MLGPGQAHSTINQPNTPHPARQMHSLALICLSMLQRISRKTLAVGKKCVSGLPSSILMKISSLKWCQSRKPAGWFCIISISNFAWHPFPAVPGLHRLCLSFWAVWIHLAVPCPRARALLAGWALPPPAHGRGLCQWCLALSPEPWLDRGQERAWWLAWPKWSCSTWVLKSMGSWRRVLHSSPAQILFYKLVQISLIWSYYGFHL